VALCKRGRFWHYEFQVNGTRYRGSTKQTIETRARQVEVRKMQEAQESGYSPLPRKAPILRDFAATVLKSFESSSLDPDTKRYYRNGWSRIESTLVANMRLDRITTEGVATLQFDGSPSWQNQALRTLSVILAKGVERHYLHQKPTIRLQRETRREIIVDDASEASLLKVTRQPLSDVLIVMRDMGLRPDEVFRMRWEHVNWERRLYFNPYGKSRKARRWIPMSQRVFDDLKARMCLQSATVKKPRRGKAVVALPAQSEWVFPSKKAESGHLTTVAKQFRDARRLAGLPEALKLYGARHAFATYAVQATGNVFAVADAMGHEDLKTTRIYQHPEMDSIRDAIDQRNRRIM
jgi:integrase